MKRNKKGQSKRIHKKWSLENFNDGIVNNKNRFMVYCPNHPRAEKKLGYIQRSIVAWEAYHNKTIPRGMQIHHIDKNTLNDKKENLVLVTTSEHQKIHGKEKMVEKECLKCHKKFATYTWRGGKFCSLKCYFAYPKSEATKNKVGSSLKKAYAEGRR